MVLSVKIIVTCELTLQIITRRMFDKYTTGSIEHSQQGAMATTLLWHFCLSEVDARHTSRLFTIQGELKISQVAWN